MIHTPVVWDRKNDKRTCSVAITMDDMDFTDSNQWLDIAQFHASMSKALADVAFFPYEREPAEIVIRGDGGMIT